MLLYQTRIYIYILHNYPKLKLKCSVLRNIFLDAKNNVDYYNKELDRFDIVVAGCNASIDTLRQVKEKDRLEVIVNETCIRHCKLKKTCCLAHEDFKTRISPLCPQHNNNSLKNISYYSIDEINELLDIGIHRLKMAGRR